MSNRPSGKAVARRRGRRRTTEPIFPSDMLPSVRQIVETVDQLRQALGPVASFHIVVDANILIGDVLWLLDKRRKRDARTSLQECIVAGTIIAYVTPSVIREVEEKLVIQAAKRGLNTKAWTAAWTDYKSTLHVREPNQATVEQYALGRDPDDAPTLALADMLGACGILTRDRDIAAMGGNAISIGFLLEARDYSRKAAVSVSIQVGGYYIIVGASEAVRFVTAATKHCTEWFRRQPPLTKLAAFLLLGSLLAHPRSRGAIASALKSTAGRFPDILLQTIQATLALIRLTAENHAVPPAVPVPAIADQPAQSFGGTPSQ